MNRATRAGLAAVLASASLAIATTAHADGSSGYQAQARPTLNCRDQSAVSFGGTIGLHDGTLTISDPSGGAHGAFIPNGTSTLTGPHETYRLNSIVMSSRNISGTEVNGGCTYEALLVIDEPTALGMTGSATPGATALSNQSAAPMGTHDESSNSVPWLILAGIGGGGLFFLALRLLYLSKHRGDEDDDYGDPDGGYGPAEYDDHDPEDNQD